jgi:hypothetical protein
MPPIDSRAEEAAETLRALRVSGEDDPFAGLGVRLRTRLYLGETEGELDDGPEFLLLAEALAALTAEAEAATHLKN